MKIHVNKEGSDLGEFTLDEINVMIGNGKLSDEDMAWHENLDDWVEIRELSGITLGMKYTHKPQSIAGILVSNIRYWLDILDDGAFIRNVFGRILQISAVLLGVLVLFLYFKIPEYLMGLIGWSPEFSGVGIESVDDLVFKVKRFIYEVFFVLKVFGCVLVMIFRGGDIIQLPDRNFVLTKIVSIFITTMGEVIFLYLMMTGLVSIVVSFISWMGEPSEWKASLLVGVPISFGFILLGFIVYVFSKWLRETLTAFYSLASDVEGIRNKN